MQEYDVVYYVDRTWTFRVTASSKEAAGHEVWNLLREVVEDLSHAREGDPSPVLLDEEVREQDGITEVHED